MDNWLQLPTSDKNKLAERELSAGLNSLKLFKLDEASKHFEGKNTSLSFSIDLLTHTHTRQNRID